MKKYWFPILLIVVATLISMIAYPSLPEEMAVHWNFQGEADDFMNKKFGAFFPILILIGMFLLFNFMPAVDPKKENYQKFKSSYQFIRQILLIFFFMIHVLTIGYNLGYPIDISIIIPLGIGVLFIIIGNYMPKFKHNYFTGIKTPWTLANEKVWVKTHRLGGKVFVLMGITMMLTTFLEGTLKNVLFFVAIIGGILFLTVASYVYYRKEV